MNMTKWIVGLYGIFTLFGGIIGYVKAKSMVSLVAGSLSGLLLLVCAFAISRGYNWAAIVGLVISLLLGGRFLMTWFKNFRFMPDLLMVVLSLASIIAIAWMLLKP